MKIAMIIDILLCIVWTGLGITTLLLDDIPHYAYLCVWILLLFHLVCDLYRDYSQWKESRWESN